MSGGGSIRPRSTLKSAACGAEVTFWVVELVLRYDGGSWKYGVDILEFRGDQGGSQVDLTVLRSASADQPEERADLFDEQRRLLERREVPAAGGLVPVADVGEAPLRPAS